MTNSTILMTEPITYKNTASCVTQDQPIVVQRYRVKLTILLGPRPGVRRIPWAMISIPKPYDLLMTKKQVIGRYCTLRNRVVLTFFEVQVLLLTI